MVYQRKWYVVIVGTEPGIYSSWIEAGPKTRHIPGGAIHQSFFSEEEAIRAFEAAKRRGEVKAYPSADMFHGNSKNTLLSPLGNREWLKTPLIFQAEVKSQPSSPIRSRVAQHRQTQRDSHLTSSPQTHVTRAYAPLYQDDDDPCNTPKAQQRPSPHLTFASNSSRAYPDVSDERLLESHTERIPPQLDVSDWDSRPATPSSSDSHPSAGEHTSKHPGCIPLHAGPPPKIKGVEYRSLNDLTDAKNVDPRIWLPKPRPLKSRIFDPDKVKPRPLTRPSSPVKKDISSPLRHRAAEDTPQLESQNSFADTSFVRCGRGRASRLTPSWSLPIWPSRELEDDHDCSGFGSPSTWPLHGRNVGKEKEIDHSVRDTHLVERPTEFASSPRNYGRSHVHLVPRDGKEEQGAVDVHCSPDCQHETCKAALSASTVGPSISTGSRVDGCVSPMPIISRIDSPGKNRPKRHLEEDPCELIGSAHIPHNVINPEADVRSPIVKGTMVPMDFAGFGRICWKNASRARWQSIIWETFSSIARFLTTRKRTPI